MNIQRPHQGKRLKVKLSYIEKKIFENTYIEENRQEKRRIAPTIVPENNINPIPQNDVITKPVNNPDNDIVMFDTTKQPKKEILEKKPVCCKINQFDSSSIYLLWENKTHDNYCTIALQVMDKFLYSNKYEGKLIRKFAYNNFFYVFYDTQNLVHVNTLFNNIVTLF
jgi:hypothetical protein